MPPLPVRILETSMRVRDERLRMPFRFGIATLTETPKLIFRVVVEDAAGRRATGHSADVLPALWFDKAPGKTIDEKVDDQLAAAALASEEYLRRGASPVEVFALWRESYFAVKEAAAARGINALTAGFGSSFAERATIDAVCRLAGTSFFEALRANVFGIDAASVHPELRGFDVASVLPPAPLASVWCRHTVGLGDPLRSGDVAEADRLNDGFPQTLEDDVATYGHRYFKIKIDGDRERNLARLSTMAAVFAERIGPDIKATLDGNEQATDLADVEWLFARLRETPAGARLADAILFVEQPLPRDRALSDESAPAIRSLARVRPLVVDESDDDVRSLVRAREVGYGGISVKNCKGVFKAILNKCLIERWRAAGEADAPTILSSEDLTNTGVIPLQEDFATIAALGIDHSERNGHHYFRGLDHLTERERESALERHPDLYERKAGTVALRIRDGRIAIGSIQAPGFGYSSEIEFEAGAEPAAWRERRGR